MADVDNLKALNDSSGHHSGDSALRLLANALARRRGRPTWSAASEVTSSLWCSTTRTGGRAGRGDATGAALRKVHGTAPVTASLGVSTWLGDDDGPDAVLRRADEALYAAKRAGRDRVALWESPETEAQAGLQWLGRRPRRRVEASRP